jgi:hypothetical protein
LGPGIELLTELHDVDTFGTECGTNRRCRIGLSAFNLQLYIARNFFSHIKLFFGDSVPAFYRNSQSLSKKELSIGVAKVMQFGEYQRFCPKN